MNAFEDIEYFEWWINMVRILDAHQLWQNLKMEKYIPLLRPPWYAQVDEAVEAKYRTQGHKHVSTSGAGTV